MLTVAKFGGSSLADADGFRRVCTILLADPARRAAVVSAPGKRSADDEKLTDTLLRCHALRTAGGSWMPAFQRFSGRVRDIAEALGVQAGILPELRQMKLSVARGCSRDSLVSRGEYFSARILADHLGWHFLDSADWLRFAADGTVDTVRSYTLLRRLARFPFVTPGFYGASADGTIRTLPRGGSDVSGALCAAALDASLYENFTDVPGLLDTDPALAADAEPVRFLRYEELNEICRLGTQVLHTDAVRPVADAGIPMRIRSTFLPEDEGTLIASALPEISRRSLLCLGTRRGRAMLALSGGDALSLAQLFAALGVRPDFYTAAPEVQTASVPMEALPAVLDGAASLAGTLQVSPSAGLLSVFFCHPADGKTVTAADIFSALRAEGIGITAIMRQYSAHSLMLVLPDRELPRAVSALRTLMS